jgi:hypothetical protein
LRHATPFVSFLRGCQALEEGPDQTRLADAWLTGHEGDLVSDGARLEEEIADTELTVGPWGARGGTLQ